MSELRYTLVADGSSDDALLPILSWLLRFHLPDTIITGRWADLRGLSARPRGLTQRLRKALADFPCALLFVHRDAEREAPDQRYEEVGHAVQALGNPVPYICVVPVRMTEAWLLFDEQAIRRAAGIPNGRGPLGIPDLRRVEREEDPKQVLQRALRQASGLTSRRLAQFRVPIRDVAGFIEDFSPLRALSTFQRLEQDVHRFAQVWLSLSLIHI